MGMKRRLAVWCAALAVVATGCTIDDPAITVETTATGGGALALPASPALIEDAAAQTASVESARFTMGITMEASAMPIPVSMSIAGEIANGGRDMAMTIDMSQFVDALAAEAGGGVGGDMFTELFAEPFEVRMIGPDVYMKASFLDMLGVDGDWAHATDPSMVDQFAGSGSSNPAEALALLETVDDDIVDHGIESIDGTEARHLSGTLDFEELAASGDADEIDQALRELESVGIDPATIREGDLFEYDAWIDSAGRLIRLEMEFRLADGGAELGRFAMKLTARFFDFGAPISIEPPPAGEVVDLDGWIN